MIIMLKTKYQNEPRYIFQPIVIIYSRFIFLRTNFKINIKSIHPCLQFYRMTNPNFCLGLGVSGALGRITTFFPPKGLIKWIYT